MTIWYAGHSDLHTRWSSTQSDIYQVSHRYNWFSWWWARSCPKHVENRNKYIRKTVHQVGLFTKIMSLPFEEKKKIASVW